ncbi:Hsp20/alpha crystallin family protein [Dechloromonas sp. ZY10]|uniref:Hsp20/alpha crystallin family protein n=1 Tax=Dechloromonas aquae TaxID=2664436 RepID=UPI003527FB57
MANLMRHDAHLDSLDDLFRGFFVRPVEFNQHPATPPAITLDVREQADAYLVHAELPGARKENIHVTVDGALVSISAEVRQERESKEGERVLRSERYFGKVSRSFQLAQEIDDSQASARFTDGVLELTLPKRSASPQRRLSIE